MIGSDLITPVRRRLVESVASFWSDPELLELLNDAERALNDKVRILEGKYITDLISAQATYPLPSNWLSEAAIFVNVPGTAGSTEPNWYRLRNTSLEKEAQENPNFLSNSTKTFGSPLSFWIWNKSLELDPVPDTTLSGAMIMFYKAKTTPLTDASQQINLDDTFKDTLVEYMLWKAWLKEKEKSFADEAHAEYLVGVRNARIWVNKRRLDHRQKIDIESPIPFSPGGSTKGFNPF